MSERIRSDDLSSMTVRDAETVDIPALTAIKGAGSEALHRDRLKDARDSSRVELSTTNSRTKRFF